MLKSSTNKWLMRRIEHLKKDDHIRFGFHEFVVETISTKEENTARCEDFVDVYLSAKSTCGRFKISGFFSEGMKVEVLKVPQLVH